MTEMRRVVIFLGRGVVWEKAQRIFWGAKNVLYFDLNDAYTDEYIYKNSSSYKV